MVCTDDSSARVIAPSAAKLSTTACSGECELVLGEGAGMGRGVEGAVRVEDLKIGRRMRGVDGVWGWVDGVVGVGVGVEAGAAGGGGGAIKDPKTSQTMNKISTSQANKYRSDKN